VFFDHLASPPYNSKYKTKNLNDMRHMLEDIGFNSINLWESSLRTEEKPEKDDFVKKNYEKNQKYYIEKVLHQKPKVKKSCPIPTFKKLTDE
jgi:hypothetical protein